jgi:hypothetical protein
VKFGAMLEYLRYLQKNTIYVQNYAW